MLLQWVPISICFVFLRFCKGFFDKKYKATIGVDFEMERFEVLGVPFSMQLWVWFHSRKSHVIFFFVRVGNTSQSNHAITSVLRAQTRRFILDTVQVYCPSVCVCPVMDHQLQLRSAFIQVGHSRSGALQVHCFYILQRSTGWGNIRVCLNT